MKAIAQKENGRVSSDPPPPPLRSKAGALVYVKHFPRPELGEHPMHDGYNVGRALARAYPEKMQQVMQGFREGVKDGTEAAERPGGQIDE